jgi:hypothetical protein
MQHCGRTHHKKLAQISVSIFVMRPRRSLPPLDHGVARGQKGGELAPARKGRDLANRRGDVTRDHRPTPGIVIKRRAFLPPLSVSMSLSSIVVIP